MQNIYYNYNLKKHIYEYGSEITNPKDYPKVPYQTVTELQFNILQESGDSLTGKDLSSVSIWKCAIDKDYLSTTEVMARVQNEDIDSSQASSGIIIVSVDSDTEPFLSAVDGMEKRTVYCNLIGYNIEGKAREFFKIKVTAENIIDPAGSPGEPESDYYNKSQTEAVAEGKAAEAVGSHESTYDHSQITTNAEDITTLQSSVSSNTERIEELEGTVWRKKVIDLVDCTAAPPTEVEGDRYIIDATGSPHADWDGCTANQIVEFNSGSWTGLTPSEAWRCYVDEQEMDARYIDDGTPQWELVPSSTASGDMLKSVYDTDDDGIVDSAEKVDGVDSAGNRKYYGTDESGTPGYHDLPESSGGGLTWSVSTMATHVLTDGSGVLIDTSITTAVQLPLSPAIGMQIGVSDYQSLTVTNNIPLDLQGEKFEGETTFTLDVNGVGFIAVYTGSTIGWKIVTEISGSGVVEQVYPKIIVSGYLSSTQNVTADVATAVLFNQLTTNEGSLYNSSTGVFTANEAMQIRIDTCVQLEGDTGTNNKFARLKYNSTYITRVGLYNHAGGVSTSQSKTINMSEGDILTVIGQTSGTSITGSQETTNITITRLK